MFLSIIIIIIITTTTTIILIWEFFTPALADGFPLDSEWQQVSRTYLSILADLNNVLV